MSYISLSFLLFTALTILVYFLFPVKKYQWVVLLAASYVFYFFSGIGFGWLILLTTLTTYGAALWIERIGLKAEEIVTAHKTDWSRDERKEYRAAVKTKKKHVLTAALVVNFGILAFLKYYNFFAENLCSWGFSAPTLRLLLPLGISFYTFQSMGYLIDVYRGKYPAEKNPARIALFVCYFPQIVQGPIGLYDSLAHQLYAPHRFDYDRAVSGFELIIWGYFKKLVIADRAVVVIDTVTAAYTNYNGTTIFLTALLYALQLYADFSAGIDISRGISQILGIDLAQNFQRPYFARSINEYWRRWHISLGGWMRDYVFYPLATSKAFQQLSRRIRSGSETPSAARIHVAKVLPTALASFVVFLLVGVWHGANWKYVGFGVWNGSIITLSVLLKPTYDALRERLHIRAESRGFALFQMLRTFVIVLIGYYFDIAPSLGGALDMLRRSVCDQHLHEGFAQLLSCGLPVRQYAALAYGAVVFFAVSLAQERQPEVGLRTRLAAKSSWLTWVLTYLCIASTLIFGAYGAGYEASAFVYMQF